MSFNSSFKQEFSEIAPLSDNKTVCRNVIERAKNMKENKKPRISKAAAGIAAAAVVAAASVTVGAANNWDFNSAFRGIFGRIAEDQRVNTDPLDNDFDFMKYGKPLDLWYDCDNFRLNVKGICADRTTVYFLYDVAFDEGYDHGAREEWTDWTLMPCIDKSGVKSKTHHGILSQSGSTISFYSSITIYDEGETLSAETLPIKFTELYRHHTIVDEKTGNVIEDEQSAECGVKAEIPLDFEICTETSSFDIHESIKFPRLDADAILESVEVTPFSWTAGIYLPVDDDANLNAARLDLSFNLSDGTSIPASMQSCGVEWTVGEYLRTYRNIFANPINPKDIVSVTVFGKTIPVSAPKLPEFSFEEYGKPLDLWYDCDNFQVNIKGICADPTNVYVLYDVIFDEDYDYAPKKGWTDWEVPVVVEAIVPGEEPLPLGRTGSISSDLISKNGNVYSYYVMSSLLIDIHDTFEGKTVTLDFYDLARAIPIRSEKDPEPYQQLESLNCGVHAEIPVDFDICRDELTFDLNESVDFSEYDGSFAPGTEAVLKNLSVTPFSFSFFVETDTSWMGKGDGYMLDMSINLKDGTSLKPITLSMDRTPTGLEYHGTNVPYYLDDIESVTVCGKTIPMK